MDNVIIIADKVLEGDTFAELWHLLEPNRLFAIK
jgi:hypothetical protein